MAAEMFSCEFDWYDKKQRPRNLCTLVGVLMALLESIFSAANSFAGLVETAIFVLDESRRAVPALQPALRRSQPACARRARQALAARTEPPSRMLYSRV